MSSGPFVFKEWKKNEEIRFVRNDNYLLGAPYLDEFVIRQYGTLVEIQPAGQGLGAVIGVAPSLVEQFKRGNLNAMFADAAELPNYVREPGLRLYEADRAVYQYIGWNQRSERAPQLRDKRVRQALSYALDVDRAIQDLRFGQASRTIAGHPPYSWAVPAGLSQ